MNLQQFAALKEGDEIIHGMNGSRGIVTKVRSDGVTVQWPPSTMEYQFAAQSTAWMHWRTDQDSAEQEPQ